MILLIAAAAAVWLLAQYFKVAIVVRAVAAAVTIVIPILASQFITGFFSRDGELAKVLAQHLRGYDRRRGIPTVQGIRQLSLLGVTAARDAHDQYVDRDRDKDLDALLDSRTFVLIIGDSKAGKSRMGAEVMRRKFPERSLIIPRSSDSLPALLDAGIDFTGSVVWLDDLQRYLEKDGLQRLLDLLPRADTPDGTTVLATIREKAYAPFMPNGETESPYWPVLQQAARLRIERLFTRAERERAAAMFTDPQLLASLYKYGLAEYLSAGPDLVDRLENASSTEPVGAMVVHAAADWSRTGLAQPVPQQVLVALVEKVEKYANRFNDGRAPGPGDISTALEWAQKPVYGVSQLLVQAPGGFTVFDYVLDHVAQARIPDEVWDAAIQVAHGEELVQVGLAAFEQDRLDIAVRVFEIAVRVFEIAVQPDATVVDATLAAYNYARILEKLDRPAEALEYYLKAADGGHAEAAYAAGRIHEARGNVDQARSNYQIAATAGHPDAAYSLGMLLRETDPDQALTWLGRAADAGHAEAAYAAHLLHATSDSSRDLLLHKAGKELAEAVREQWSRNVARISDPYPLGVPFSVVTIATPDLSDVDPMGKRVSANRDGAAASSREEPIPVMDTWTSILGNPAAEPLVLDAAFADIATVFATDGLQKRMVILGEPGSGKSMIAQWLTVHLLESHPEMSLVPVFLSLATWDPDNPLEEWAAAEIAQTYLSRSNVVQTVGNKKRTLAHQLIAGKRVLMVLDGLDEMVVGNQCDALQGLSEFARSGQHFVVTCRTRDYARIVDQAGAPLAKTPVIALGALEIDDVIQYLKDTNLIQGPSAGRWDRFLEHLVTAPDGPLAIAMTSPLVMWLVRTNYERPETHPDELIAWGSAEEITDFLLNGLVDGLVDAAYSVAVFKKNMEMYPVRKPEERKIQKERLVYLADYLSRQLPKVDSKTEGENKADIEWWYLPRVVPKWFTGGTIGLISGCLLGASVGLAATIKFGHSVGLVVGIAFAIVVAVHAGMTSVRWQDVPRAVGFSAKLTFPRFASCLAVGIGVAVCFGYAADRGGGWLPGLVTAVVVGPLCAMAIRPTFGIRPAVATAVSASLALGLGASLFGHWSAPLISAGAAGLTFLVSAWVFTGVFQNASRMKAVSPESLLRGDRNGSLIVALTVGLAFAVVFGLAQGPLVGLLAFVGLTVTVALTVSMWGAFTITRIWLALFHGMPLGIMGFLCEADSRGVLRREGGAFQFRHAKLQERLADSVTRPILIPVPPSRTDTERDGQGL